MKPTSEARYLFITSGDGFYETVDLDFVAEDERIMLAYSWDGRPIPFDHGFPLRIWLPDRYGMKQPKWITGIEVIGEYKPGYWVERNWDEVARIRTTSVIDTVAVDAAIDEGEEKLIPIGGIAFAGVRGISKVEIQVDGEGPWHEAQLRKPLSEATWVIWRFDWPFSEGGHKFEVRTVEADGTRSARRTQPAEAQRRDRLPLQERPALVLALNDLVRLTAQPGGESPQSARRHRRLELIDAALERIEKTDGVLNALPTLCADRAQGSTPPMLSRSSDPDDAPPGYLYGLPIAIKDLKDVAGVRSTRGSPIFADSRPKRVRPARDDL